MWVTTGTGEDDSAARGPPDPLNRDRVLHAAVALADDAGIESLSMRRLAQELGVVPMALYKHVANKEELLDGMVDVVVGEIDPPVPDAGWRSAVRLRVLSARRALQRHRWARQVVESRTNKTPAVLDYMDSFTGMFLAGGFSVDLTHHVMHAIGGRMWGFTQELFDDPAGPKTEAPAEVPPAARAAMPRQMAGRYPNIVAFATSMTHDGGAVVGHGCDDQFEFEFALDLLLDGFERLHEQGWTSKQAKLERG
ncbi:TetR family transcriptional regulator [Arthrobacter sp. PAMC25564]|uniref:TetR/AcrR family transcriptional regulator C-terminal domain-containing protein n=1 Tax=Arthrobacter sp. PAMC25564 TaxID=2565366 RepID=UPI0010A25C30|nr:TetR/AcrR family transcriptional regulator C-terminal domain-containing protein [Arthrobacter sp. PAMC25564]QCB97846.1 TetR family transcriptional regulator [Arthrobacter sp. PAMC25564]